jgi:hypothetical protein
MSHEPSNPTLRAEAPSAGTIRTRRTLSPLSPSRASLVSREWTTNTAFCSWQISPADRRLRDSSPSMVSARSSSRSTASAHSASRSASTSCSRACFSARHRSICSSILRSTPSIRSVLPSISCSFPWAAWDADGGLLLLGVSHLTTFRPFFSLLWVALVGHLLASCPPPRIDRAVAGIPEERCRRVDLGHAGHQGHPNAQRFDAVVTRAKPRRELEERENGETPRTRGAGPTFRKQS